MDEVTEYGYTCNVCNIVPDWEYIPPCKIQEMEVENPDSGEIFFFTKADLERMLAAMED